MAEHTADLNLELTSRGLEEFLLVGWTNKLKELKKHEQHSLTILLLVSILILLGIRVFNDCTSKYVRRLPNRNS